MKKLTLIAIASLNLTVLSAQMPLQNTKWKLYDLPNKLYAYIRFTSDTVSYSSNNTYYSNISTFKTTVNSFSISDLPPSTCAGNTGLYTFSIKNDTLSFVLISDLCYSRPEFFTQNTWVRLEGPTGIQKIDPISQLNVFPNPFNTQTIITFEKPVKDAAITMRDLSGKIVRQVDHINDQRIILHRDNLPDGLYFILLTIDGITTNCNKIMIAD